MLTNLSHFYNSTCSEKENNVVGLCQATDLPQNLLFNILSVDKNGAKGRSCVKLQESIEVYDVFSTKFLLS